MHEYIWRKIDKNLIFHELSFWVSADLREQKTSLLSFSGAGGKLVTIGHSCRRGDGVRGPAERGGGGAGGVSGRGGVAVRVWPGYLPARRSGDCPGWHQSSTARLAGPQPAPRTPPRQLLPGGGAGGGALPLLSSEPGGAAWLGLGRDQLAAGGPGLPTV